jgi:hypothetical protein
MTERAPFQAVDEPIRASQSYHAIPIPPLGEIVAWFFTSALAVLSGVLIWLTGTLPFWAPLFTILALLLALSIRFSRWLEANKTIRISLEGIFYSSPISKHELDWDQISKLVADPVGNGWRIYVFGQNGGFRFQTETKMRGMRGAELRTGYPGGAEIVGQIISMADLGEAEFDGSTWTWLRR